ncbi:MAG: pantoate--beta-alanine ligase [Solirubrobacteraceae bacterium]
MRTIRRVSELRAAVCDQRARGRRVGLVPTMGALHAGHLSLVQRARPECDLVVISLFVNPRQFGLGEDLAAYPRSEAADAAQAESAGADILFVPTAQEVYPDGFSTSISVGDVAAPLCGAVRGPEHFAGVATVVCKLLNMASADIAYFGQKDAQQSVVIRRMVRDLDMPVRIEICPTVREPDGLAMSSRNAYLEPEQRRRASGLNQALTAAEQAVAGGERNGSRVVELTRRQLAAHGLEPEYVELVCPETLHPVADVEGPVLLAVAAQVGRARLIDNFVIDPRK